MDMREAEIDANYEAFNAMLPTLMALAPGKYALMKERQVIGAFDGVGGALQEGFSRYGVDGLFSIQEITDQPICLGWYSYVEPLNEDHEAKFAAVDARRARRCGGLSALGRRKP